MSEETFDLERFRAAKKKQLHPSLNLKRLKLQITAHCENLDYELIEDDIMIPQRDRSLAKPVKPEDEDFYFQMNDATFLRDLFDTEDVTSYLADEEYNDSSKNYDLNQAKGSTQVYIHGIAESGHSVCVKYVNYKPFFYLSIPDSVPRNDTVDLKTAKSLVDEMKSVGWLPWSQVDKYSLVYTLPAVGFRNGEKKPFILFEFKTKYACKRFINWVNKKFPPPKKIDIENKTYQNDWVMGEEKVGDPVKMANAIGVQWCGWAKLPKGTYRNYQEEDICTIYTLEASVLEHEALKQEIAPFVLDSFDLETLRWDEQDAFSNPSDPRDAIASIAHCLEISDGSWEPIFYIFTWGGRVNKEIKDEKRKSHVSFKNSFQDLSN